MNCGDQSSGCLSHAESASWLRQLGVYVFGSAVTVTRREQIGGRDSTTALTVYSL